MDDERSVSIFYERFPQLICPNRCDLLLKNNRAFACAQNETIAVKSVNAWFRGDSSHLIISVIQRRECARCQCFKCRKIQLKFNFFYSVKMLNRTQDSQSHKLFIEILCVLKSRKHNESDRWHVPNEWKHARIFDAG